MSLRDQLAKKRARTTTESFPIGEEGEQAAEKYETAKRSIELLDLFIAKGQTVDKSQAESDLAAALTKYREHSITLTFRGLSPSEYDALQDEYAVDPEDKDAKVDLRGYTGALLSAAVADSDLTADEWITELFDSGRWSEGEVRRLRHAAQDAYAEASGPAIPKG